MKTILVTGADGFVGRHLCQYLVEKNHRVIAAVRSSTKAQHILKYLPKDAIVEVGNICEQPDWSSLLQGVDVVVHLASRVHIMKDNDPNPLAAFRQMNVRATERLVGACIDAKIEHVIYMSSVKVHGEENKYHGNNVVPFSETDKVQPDSPYGLSKWEAEQAITRMTKGTDTAVTVLRPPLVYGPGVRANFLKLILLLKKGWPLPLGAVANKRSFVYVQNLVDAIYHCMMHASTKNQTFLVSDGDDLSTTQLIQLMAEGMDINPWLIRFPTVYLTVGARLLGKSEQANRLLGDLTVNIDKLKSTGWLPPVNVNEGLLKTVSGFGA